jgi:SAM-dependent methyltransferase
MADFEQTDWYRFPRYYDIIFGPDTVDQADFLEAVLERHGPARLPKQTHLLEPACGSGRLVIEMAQRGHLSTGFDASAEMLAYAKHRASQQPPDVRRSIRLREAWMQNFRLRGPFHLAHCLLSTFKYLLTEDDARAHLERVSRALTRGGLLVLGLHLTDYRKRTNDTEIWREEENGVSVTCQTITRPANAKTRLESLRNRLHIKLPGVRKHEHLETNWLCRTYNLPELKSLLASVPSLKLVACYDFNHDINTPCDFEATEGDPVVVLQKL